MADCIPCARNMVVVIESIDTLFINLDHLIRRPESLREVMSGIRTTTIAVAGRLGKQLSVVQASCGFDIKPLESHIERFNGDIKGEDWIAASNNLNELWGDLYQAVGLETIEK